MAKSREPTLLHKLLSSDIKRDRHRLLHTFKFMALNNFFKDWPDKPLQFPIVKVNQIEIEDDVATGNLDDLENDEMAEDSRIDTTGNGVRKELSSIDEETGIADSDEEDGASADSSDEDGVEDADEEQSDEAEDDAAA
jgi:cleavage and polyadenylation specificity factor subunit 4